MYYCDVVRGTKDLVGPFSGKSELDTVYDFNSQEKVEGEKNNYRIYRKLDQSLDQIEKNNSILNSSHEKDVASGWDIYTIEMCIRDREPVMSLDYDAPQFGMGQMIYPDGEDQAYLTYSKSHNCLLYTSRCV